MSENAISAGRRSPRRWRRMAAALLALVTLAVLAQAYGDTMAEPRVQRLRMVLPGLPAASEPIRLAFVSDIHVAGPDMPPERLASIVEQINALQPDLVVIGGDLVDDKRAATRHYSADEAIAPLAGLRPKIATLTVAGNHDHAQGMGAVRQALDEHGIILLTNEARRFGPLTIGGLDDDSTGKADLPATLAQMERLGGAGIVLTHSPDVFPDLPRSVALTLAGHTHCGQIRYPWGSAPATASRYGDRYACGLVREGGRVLVTTAGLGTSVLPVRFGTRPEIWLIELLPPESGAPTAASR